jgi:hypothetical protein
MGIHSQPGQEFEDRPRCWHPGCEAPVGFGVERAYGGALGAVAYCQRHAWEVVASEVSAPTVTRIFRLGRDPSTGLRGGSAESR